MATIHEKNYPIVLKTIDYILKHPYLSSLEAQLRPEFTFKANEINGADHNIRDVVLKLIQQIALMNRLNVFFDKSQLERPENTDEENLQIFLDLLYQKFQEECNNLRIQNKELSILEKHLEEEKRVQQLIHDFKKNKRFKTLGEEMEKDFQQQKVKHRDIEALRAQLEAQYAELKKLKKLIHAFARANELECQIVNNTKLQTQTKEEKAQARIARKKIKSKLNIVSFSVSLIVGLGEGLVAAVFATVMWPFALALLLVGVGGFACNYYLFRGDSFAILKDIYFGTVWKDEKGNPVSGKKKAFVYSTLIFSLSGGLCFGFLSFSSALIAFGKLFFGLTAVAAIAAPPVGLAILAGFIGIVTAVALFTVFAYITANFARKDGFRKLVQKAKHIYEDFGKDWQEQKTKKAQVKFIAKTILSAFIHVVFFALAAAMSVVVILASNALFQHKTLTMLHSTFHMAAQLASKTADVMVFGLGAISNAVFNVRGIFAVANTVKQAVFALAHPVETVKKIQDFYHSVKNNNYRKIELMVTFAKRLSLFDGIGFNGWGQSCGFATNPYSQQAVNTAIPTDTQGIIQFSTFFGSAAPNLRATVAATRTTHGMPKPETIVSKVGFFSRYSVREVEKNSAPINSPPLTPIRA